MPQTTSFLDVALEAVQAAEHVIKKYYQQDIRATLKDDQSPVTIADKEAEEIIKQTISARYPDHSFLGEESGQTDRDSEYIWIIDPIDGTKHYTRQIPLFATQLALMKDDEVILGVSNAPEMNELLYAEKGAGAFLNEQQVSVSSQDDLARAYMSYGGIGYFDKHDQMQQLLKIERDTQGHRGIGDFWSYHLVASGKIEMMIEAETKIWDVAAVACIVEEAGGTVTDIKGEAIGKTTDSLVATNGVLHQQVLSYFNG
jgi:histidinol-phosphatase